MSDMKELVSQIETDLDFISTTLEENESVIKSLKQERDILNTKVEELKKSEVDIKDAKKEIEGQIDNKEDKADNCAEELKQIELEKMEKQEIIDQLTKQLETEKTNSAGMEETLQKLRDSISLNDGEKGQVQSEIDSYVQEIALLKEQLVALEAEKTEVSEYKQSVLKNIQVISVKITKIRSGIVAQGILLGEKMPQSGGGGVVGHPKISRKIRNIKKLLDDIDVANNSKIDKILRLGKFKNAKKYEMDYKRALVKLIVQCKTGLTQYNQHIILVGENINNTYENHQMATEDLCSWSKKILRGINLTDIRSIIRGDYY